MTIRVSIAIQSHLSDAAIEMSFNPEQANRRIQFVKWLVMLFPDTSVQVEESELNEIYRNRVLKQETANNWMMLVHTLMRNRTCGIGVCRLWVFFHD